MQDSVLASLSPAHWEALADALAEFPAVMRERGRSYAERGCVGPLSFGSDAVGALVRGSEVYRVWWIWNGEDWESTCTCPVGRACKHQYAVGCCIALEARDRQLVSDRRFARLLPEQAVANARLGTPDPPPTEGDDASPVGASPGGESDLHALRNARDIWGRVTAVQQLLSDGPPTSIRLFAPPFRDALEERDFDVMCWHLARLLPEWTMGWLPPALEPYRKREDLERRHMATLRKALASRLEDWSTDGSQLPERSLRFLVGLFRRPGDTPLIAVEPLLSARRLDDDLRSTSQLRHLLGEAQRNPAIIAPEQLAVLECYLENLTGWTNEGEARAVTITTAALRRLAEINAGGSTLQWRYDLDAELVSRGGLAGGTPVRTNPRPASLVPRCSLEGESMTMGLHFSWPDGTTRPMAGAVLLRQVAEGSPRMPSLVISDGAVSTLVDQPPEDIVEQFTATHGLPLERVEHRALLQSMAQRWPSVRASLTPVTRVIKVTPAVAIDLRDEWVHIRVFANDPAGEWKPLDTVAAGQTVYEYGPDRAWMPFVAEGRKAARPAFAATLGAGEVAEGVEGADGSADALVPVAADAAPVNGVIAAHAVAAAPVDPAAPAATAAPDAPEIPAWLERLDDEALAPVIEWLRNTGAQGSDHRVPGGKLAAAPDRTRGWWVKLDARWMRAFDIAWGERPTSVRWYVTPDMKRLLSDGPRARARVHVKSHGVDWFTVSAEWEAEGLSLTEEDMSALRRATGPFVRVSSGWVRRESQEALDEASGILADLGIEPGTGEQQLSIWQLSQVDPESLRAFEAFGADPETLAGIEALRERVAAFQGIPKIDPPAGLTGTLRPYQQEGIEFLAHTTELGLGTILADDMGLGKTIQALAWLLWLRERDPNLGPALVVCPASVVHNWEREAAQFAPGLRVALLTRGGRRKALMSEAANHDLLVTNYALLRRDLEAWRELPLGAAILDEAQNIKNPAAAVARAATSLTVKHRLALTGTPLENRALDLWSIMSFVNPGLLGTRTAFSTRYERADAPPHVPRLLAARLKPVLLRRLKKDVAQDLPERIEERRDCDLHASQRRLYLAEMVRSQALVANIANTPQGIEGNKIEILAALTRLRLICCHPALAGGGPQAGSGKFDALWEILEPLLAEGHKVLLFSQFVRCLELLKTEMTERGIAHHLLTGQTVKREKVVQDFRDDPRPGVFLISLKAGGTGLNLTEASYVVLFDPWWNPAVEAQAIDRTHRIGQTRNVIAFRMLTRGTIEEKIWELQQRKAALARDVLGEDGFARTLTKADLEYLLSAE